MICLQNVSLMCGITRILNLLITSIALWFAYRMYLWCVESQGRKWLSSVRSRCDLLTECIFDVWNHKSSHHTSSFCMLWFAYRMYLWCVESQEVIASGTSLLCCDLLTECIFDVWNHKSSIVSSIVYFRCDLLTECIFDVWNHKKAWRFNFAL